jgi:hypothetical protein
MEIPDSIARFEQRDAGIYIEIDAIALSREIPAVVRFVADPIVRRMSRCSLLAWLQQTVEAVRSSLSRLLGLPAFRQVPNNSAAFRQHFRISSAHLLKFIQPIGMPRALNKANSGFTQTKGKRNKQQRAHLGSPSQQFECGIYL